MDRQEIIDKISHYPSWSYDEEKDALVMSQTLLNFLECVAEIDKIAEIAEELSHHPDIRIFDYKNIEVSIRSHDADSITEKDFEFVKKLSKLSSKDS